MGVAGAGKSTVGAGLARALGWPFFDGDDFHPQANVDKMAAGIPLTDADRWPWLDKLHMLMAEQLASGHSLVLACSALKESYRQHLIVGLGKVQFVYLKGSYDELVSRLGTRRGHYMKPEMLRSQLEVLEEPKDAILVDIELAIVDIVSALVEKITN